MTGKVVGGYHIKINVILVASYLSGYQIVTTGGIGIIGRAITGKTSMSGIANSVPVLRRDVIPVGKISINNNCFSRTGGLGRIYAFEFSNIVNHLVIVTVGVAADHRFSVPAVFMVVLIDKHCIGIIAVCCSRKYRPLQEFACYPFIPAGDENKFRINGQSSIPLFLEVQAVIL